ncbi:hypothetical protein ACHQM5_009018 [Ranunculus cassubicifolius]
MSKNYENKSDEFSDDDSDDSDYNDDMERVKRTCALAGTLNPNFKSTGFPATTDSISISDSDNEGSSEIDDVELVKKLQQTYNLEPVFMEPLKILDPVDGLSDDSDIDYEDDYETWSAIERRFASYTPASFPEKNTDIISNEIVVQGTCTPLGSETPHTSVTKNVAVILGDDYLQTEEPCNSSLSPVSCNDTDNWNQSFRSANGHQPSKSPILPSNYSGFRHSKSSHYFIDAIKKNRSFQKLIRSKLIHIEAKIEENKKLKERIKLLKDFHFSCKLKAGKALTQKKDAKIQLISSCNSRFSRTSKGNDKKVSPLNFGPVENSHVATYRMLMKKFPHSLRRESWSDAERGSLGQGIKQQVQEMMFEKSLVLFSDPNASSADSNTFDDIIASITNFDIPPESVRSFVPKVDWEHLASLFLSGRSGAECEARWLNHEDPLINHNKWTQEEDKNLLDILNQRGIHNWIDISTEMAHRGIHKTPFQCLARYQRSLNANVMKRSWTTEEDAQLRSAVEILGQKDWQGVASYIEGRTGTQCSTRWKKTLDPAREKEGEWSIDEDKRLKVAVIIFGAKTWNKIAQFVPGRTQAQCRTRWVDCLDPSTSLAGWTPEEDSKLIEALNQQREFEEEIPKRGYSWSMVAKAVPRRTNKQCMRRWRVLFPHEVPLLQAARRVQRQALISNFVDREEERPALGPCDFLALPSNVPGEAENCNRKEKRKRREEKSSKNKKDTLPSDYISKSKKGGSRPRKRKRDTELSHADQCDEMYLDEDPTVDPTASTKAVDAPQNGESTSRNKRRRKSCPRLKKCDEELPMDPDYTDYQELPPSSEQSRYLEIPNNDNFDHASLEDTFCLPPEHPETAIASAFTDLLPETTYKDDEVLSSVLLKHVERRISRRTKGVLNSDELEDNVPLGWFLKKRGKRKRNGLISQRF